MEMSLTGRMTVVATGNKVRMMERSAGGVGYAEQLLSLFFVCCLFRAEVGLGRRLLAARTIAFVVSMVP